MNQANTEGAITVAPALVNAVYTWESESVLRISADDLASEAQYTVTIGTAATDLSGNALAEYVTVPARNLLKIPDSVDYGTAAAASLVFLTAWHSLITRGRLQAGENVLIVGASGGVNTASIQIAKLAGATVFVVGANKQKLALAESLGADHLIDRSERENWSKAVYQATNRQGVDVVVDNVGAGTMPSSLRSAAKGGRILTVGNTGGPTFEIDNRFIFGKHLSIIGSTMSSIEDFRTVMGLVFQGKLKAVIDRSYPLEVTAEGQRRLEAGEQLGKIVIDIPA